MLVNAMPYVVQTQLGRFLKNVERQYKAQKVELSDAKTVINRLEDRAKIAHRRPQRAGAG